MENSPATPRKPRLTRKTHTIGASNGTLVTVSLTRARAIRAFCTECLGYEENPDTCTTSTCPLYPFRGRKFLASCLGRWNEKNYKARKEQK